MTFRVRPAEIKVPEGDPFKNDLLDCKERVAALSDVVTTIEGPCVMAVDGEWGTGKTTFLRLWAGHLRDTGFPVVEHNAWKTDFVNDPFVPLFRAISSELEKIAQPTTEPSKEERWKDLREHLNALRDVGNKLMVFVPKAIDLVPGTVGVAGRILVRILCMVMSSRETSKHRMRSDHLDAENSYQETKNLFCKFRQQLRKVAGSLDTKRLIVFVDELDRCRPSYAIEFLEITKHLFGVDRVVFVLAVNQTQLRCAVNSLYGASFDSQRYLRRFFDHTIPLSPSDRTKFVKQQLTETGLDGLLRGGPYGEKALRWVKAYCGAPRVSLRDIEQMIRHIGLVLSSLTKKARFQVATAVAIIVRSAAPDVYGRIIKADITDDEACKALQDRSSLRSLEDREVFEAAVIMACRDMIREDEHVTMLPRYQRYCASPKGRAGKVLGVIKMFDRDKNDKDRDKNDKDNDKDKYTFGFRSVVTHLDFLATQQSGDEAGKPGKP